MPTFELLYPIIVYNMITIRVPVYEQERLFYGNIPNFSKTVFLKTIVVVRHAKSDQSFWGNDFERPLNERGRKDAPVMAQRLYNRNLTVDAFVSSPATRALSTARVFAAAFGKKDEDIVQVSSLYHAPSPVFYECILGLPEAWQHVALFAHNPGITNFVNTLTDAVQVDNMPTCGIFAVEADCDHWADFKQATKRFLFFDYPKKQHD